MSKYEVGIIRCSLAQQVTVASLGLPRGFLDQRVLPGDLGLKGNQVLVDKGVGLTGEIGGSNQSLHEDT